MNREIKFRAWNKEEKKMVSLTSNAFTELLVNDCFEKLQEKYEIMQYTGLKDRNGKDIYEGDVIRFDDAYEQGGQHTADVRFLGGAFKDGAFGQNLTDRKNIEVIGDIYSNPDLL